LQGRDDPLPSETNELSAAGLLAHRFLEFSAETYGEERVIVDAAQDVSGIAGAPM